MIGITPVAVTRAEVRTWGVLWARKGALHPLHVIQSSGLWVPELVQSTWRPSVLSNWTLKDSYLAHADGIFKKLHIWLN